MSLCDHFHSSCWITYKLRYVNLISSLLKPQGRIFFCSLSYERGDRTGKTRELSSICIAMDNYVITTYIGPPFPASTDLIKSHYGKFSDVYIYTQLCMFKLRLKRIVVFDIQIFAEFCTKKYSNICLHK